MIYTIELKNLPFDKESRQILYIENEYDEVANTYIQNNYEFICELFESKGYEFCYLPRLIKEVAKADILNYYAPYDKSISKVNISSNFILNYMSHPENRDKIKPSLLFVDDSCTRKGENIIFKGLFLDELHYNTNNLMVALDEIVNEISRYNYEIRFRIVESEPSMVADFFDDEETIELMGLFMNTVGKLKQKGIKLYLLEQLIYEPEKISRMHITRDYRIILPDYNNMEIKMTPLIKAVYILFLRHLDGIVFKSLPDYYNELLYIYLRLKRGNDSEKVRKRIMALVEYDSNAINEACSRIRRTFLNMFDEHLAKYYIISGERGESRKVTLPSDMIMWL